ncbi:amidohydrolase family protein [Sinanaerobacter sp. ZZT-01]|uniref:amidohydrolase family protein n=1 Tax=Sinanaerobacter sp. ZZT-01 TaxID=3111540 RepID=UPI002D779D0B|nr:amidohydrolase family protein [Sinanaerobacter sp. ZZT-01]WRR93294.1 amidohydrolase family protein [Sinanaerobacter sp. ZZT-01]
MLDILIKSAQYPDYEKGEMLNGDIGIKDGKILKIGKVTESAKQVISAEGKVVSPGFIDIHMHEEDFINEGERYVISEMMLKMGVTTCLGGNCGLQHQSVRSFKKTISRLGGAPVNYMLLAGYNSMRTQAGMGRYEETPEILVSEISKKIKKEIEDGAFGVSFGLEYDPGITFDEVIKVLNELTYDDIFVSMHYREDSAGSSDAIREMIEIAKVSKKKFQISHLSSCSAMGQMKDALKEINDAIVENPKLDYDTYPYNAFSTSIGSAVFNEGCFERWNKSYEDILLTDEPYKNCFCDKELFVKARSEHPQMLAVAFVMNEEEISEAISNPYGMIASDGIINNGNGHPRAAGTFPRVLGRYVRETKCISMINALRKMTFEPAKRLGLNQKGQIQEGFDADLTIFDPKIIMDGATFEDITVAPIGINFVLLNGSIALKDGKLINDRLGQFISSELKKNYT